MDFSFAAALGQLRPDAPFMIANEARPPASYLFAMYLPERLAYTYSATSGAMTIRPTMAGISGMDSPYSESGVISTNTFTERTLKVTNAVRLPEEALRTLQDILQRLQINAQPTVDTMMDEALNFEDKLIVQPHLDTSEWMRGQALVNGKINWTFNSKPILVDYQLPSSVYLPNRTGAAAYGGSSSSFWADVSALQKALNYNVQAYILHPETWNAILANSINNITVSSSTVGMISTYNIQRLVSRTRGTATELVPSPDARESIQITTYGMEGEIFDLDNPGQTKRVPFMPRGKMLALANNTGSSVYVVGQGSTPQPEYALGYTHLGPTVEGNGMPGRWARIFTPQNRPWSLEGEGVANQLPVIESYNYNKLAVASTDMP